MDIFEDALNRFEEAARDLAQVAVGNPHYSGDEEKVRERYRRYRVAILDQMRSRTK